MSSFDTFIKDKTKTSDSVTEEVVYEATCDAPDTVAPSTKPLLARGDEDFAPTKKVTHITFDLSNQPYCGFCDPSQEASRDENIHEFMKLQPDESNDIKDLLPDEQELVATSRTAEFLR